MLSFHISPKTMEPRVCEASEGKCPLGATTPHIGEDQILEHFKIFEMAMADFELVSFKRKDGKAVRRWDIKERCC